MRRSLGVVVTAGALAFALTGCGPDEVTKTLQSASFEVGGAVVYALDDEIALEAVTVTLTDMAGKAYETTTNVDGLWVIPGVPAGVYSTSFVLDGYEPEYAKLTLDSVGENDFKHKFVGLDDVLMWETPLKATLSAPLAAEIEDQDSLTHGVGGLDLVYSKLSGTFITLTFNKPIFSTSTTVVQLRDTVSFATIYAVPNQDRTVWTFAKAAIDGMGTQGLNVDSNPFTLHQININNALSYTDIHGDTTTLSATVNFDCAP